LKLIQIAILSRSLFKIIEIIVVQIRLNKLSIILIIKVFIRIEGVFINKLMLTLQLVVLAVILLKLVQILALILDWHVKTKLFCIIFLQILKIKLVLS